MRALEKIAEFDALERLIEAYKPLCKAVDDYETWEKLSSGPVSLMSIYESALGQFIEVLRKNGRLGRIHQGEAHLTMVQRDKKD